MRARHTWSVCRLPCRAKESGFQEGVEEGQITAENSTLLQAFYMKLVGAGAEAGGGGEVAGGGGEAVG